MNKIKKALMFCILTLVMIIMPQFSTNATDLWGYRNINYNTLNNNESIDVNGWKAYLYCVNHGAPLNAWQDAFKKIKNNVYCNGYGKRTYYTKSDGTRTSFYCGSSIGHEYSQRANGGYHIIADTYDYVLSSTPVWYAYQAIDKIQINWNETIADGNYAYSTRLGTSTRNEYNAKMAYIAAHGTGYHGDFYIDKQHYSEAQMAIYHNFRNFISPFHGAWGNDDTTYGSNKADSNSILKGANEYWNKLQQWQKAGGVFTDSTVKDQSGKVNTNLVKYNSRIWRNGIYRSWPFKMDISW